jgi:hypothetical protein
MQIEITLRFYLTQLKWPFSRAKTTTNAGEDAVKKESYTLLVGMQISIIIMESNMEIPQKAKTRRFQDGS